MLTWRSRRQRSSAPFSCRYKIRLVLKLVGLTLNLALKRFCARCPRSRAGEGRKSLISSLRLSHAPYGVPAVLVVAVLRRTYDE